MNKIFVTEIKIYFLKVLFGVLISNQVFEIFPLEKDLNWIAKKKIASFENHFLFFENNTYPRAVTKLQK